MPGIFCRVIHNPVIVDVPGAGCCTRGNGLVGELHRQGILALRSIGGELCDRGKGSLGMDEKVSGFIFREFSI